MKFYQPCGNKLFCVTRTLALLIGVCIFAISITAQKFEAPQVSSASLEQCRNGTSAAPDVCTGSGWGNGNANSTQAHWAESEFVAYRMLITGLTPGATVHTLTIGYDIKKSGTHAIDYLGTFNFTETTADPCSGVAGCTLGSPTSTIGVPDDTVTVTNQINPNTLLPVIQTPGQFTMWGGNLLTVAYEPYGGGDERQITLTFTASVADPVIAWGGHIAWIGDWGAGNSASSISGSPYHMRLGVFDGSGGNQDHGLAAAAVIPSGVVFIKKVVVPLNGTGSTTYAWPFTATANFGSTSFSLIDDNAGPGIDTKQSQSITSFGAGNTITVTEGTGPLGWTISSVNCAENVGVNSTQNGLGPSATIIVDIGETVICTFTNTQLTPSAAMVPISGRVLTSNGRSISSVRVMLTDDNGVTRTAISSSFGYYRFDDVEVGRIYVMSALSKRYQFNPQVVSLTDELTGFNLIALE
jgi:hypothetical protein